MTRKRTWRLPVALLALGAIPVISGVLRMVEFFDGPTTMPARTSFEESPAPMVVHIAAALTYVVLGALQFSAGLRRQRPRWHRMSGRALVPLGLTAAVSALWMNEFYELPSGPNPLLYVFRLVFGSAMAVSIVLGLLAILRRDVRRHRMWMARAYAIGLGAGTQAFTIGFGEAFFGTGEVRLALMHASAWVINLSVAEWAMRRRPRRRSTRQAAPTLAPVAVETGVS
jgi:uncharacterized membrane protein